ncbi:xanthine dehydrogenase family protein molybdopterin-binding subunit [Yinghuangia seranimata]|uniref:xanthine dehydrogenase family protein molybdopterin-binding subunit n=1 Tax=Yinghuangia seranimata TaxID=408067 RepID=UPI00248BB03F|nr:xanthine dehydrogenase family protein molybdopterin-binding subunit [Yinghuangia seranimata]MDI2127668.1 xanthine dehydrogenase family protein molybdopterin-binding subunit [Yinghuangia seranimata]
MTAEILGRGRARVEGPAKVTGAAKYAADLHPSGLAYGYLVLATVGRGTVTAVDAEAALASPGVLAVYSPFNPLKLYGGIVHSDQSFLGQNWLPLQDAEVRHHGQIVGLVVADTFEQARRGAALVRVVYDARPPVADFAAALPNAVSPGPINGEPDVLDLLAPGVPSIEAALAAAPVRAGGTYTQPPKNPVPLEPHATVAVWDQAGLTLHLGTQAAMPSALTVAAALGQDPARVRVLSEHVGGGFGGKLYTWAHPLLTAAAAQALGRPVKTVITHEQMFSVTGNRTPVHQTVELGASADGALQAVKHEAVSGLSTSGLIFEQAAHTTSRYLYKAPNIHVAQKVAMLDAPPSTWMRAPGEEPGSFALESAMDELAAKLNLDPVELRLRNYSTVVPGRGVPWSSKHLDECYRLGAARFGWNRRAQRPGSVREGDWLIGYGMASAAYPGNQFPYTMAKVRLRADGGAEVSSATADLGTGMRTVLSSVVAERLGLPGERVAAVLGDSVLPMNYGAFASAGTASTATAARAAASAAVAQLVQVAVQNAASPFHGLDPKDVVYAEGRLTGPGGLDAAFGELLTRIDVSGVEAQDGSAPPPDARNFAVHSFGAHFCEVRVHAWTSEVRLRRFTSVIDAGRIVNERTARSQIAGGLVFGIGQALFEGSVMEPASGRTANANLAEYLIPVNADVPVFDIQFLSHPDTNFNEFGARGIGELGTVGSAAAIANALFNATGRRVRDLPVTVDKLFG